MGISEFIATTNSGICRRDCFGLDANRLTMTMTMTMSSWSWSGHLRVYGFLNHELMVLVRWPPFLFFFCCFFFGFYTYTFCSERFEMRPAHRVAPALTPALLSRRVVWTLFHPVGRHVKAKQSIVFCEAKTCRFPGYNPGDPKDTEPIVVV